MAEAPKPIIDTLLAKAANKEDIQLSAGELREIALDGDKVVEEATVRLKAKEQLQHLSKEVRQETAEEGGTSELEDVTEPLEEIAQRIDTHASTLPDEPAAPTLDFKAPEDGKANANVIQKALAVAQKSGLKGFGAILRALSDVMKMMPNANLFGINPQQLNLFEKMYDKFFGATEARLNAATALKDSGIAVREGTGDSDAYGKLHTKYQTQINERLKLDASGKSPLSQVEQDGIRAFTFEKFLAKEAKDYGAKHGGTPVAGKERATTLSGIVNDAKPVETVVENDRKKPVAPDA